MTQTEILKTLSGPMRRAMEHILQSTGSAPEDIQEPDRFEKYQAARAHIEKLLKTGLPRRGEYRLDNIPEDQRRPLIDYLARLLLFRRGEFQDDFPKFQKPQKGLLLQGRSGLGKTYLLQILENAAITPTVLSMNELQVEYEADGWEGVKRRHPDLNRNDCTLYDLGFAADRGHFGNKDFSRVLLDERYVLWQRYGKLTHMTSNFCNMADLTKIYGEAISQRVYDQVFRIQLSGDCLRAKDRISDFHGEEIP